MARRIAPSHQIVIDTLYRVGPVRDEDGGATRVLHEAMGGGISEKALANTLKKMDDLGLVVRDVKGKRTYGIGLPGEGDRRVAAGDGRESVGRDHTPPSDRAGERGVGASSTAPRAVGVDWSEVADALLRRVGEILANGDAAFNEAELDDIKTRLNDALERANTQARRLMAMGEELAAVKIERDGLRDRVRACESNIEAMLRAGNRVGPGERAFKALERFMQETPKGKG